VTSAARLLALDVDGTLLTTDERLTDRNRDALHRAEARGWHVVVVTGRPLPVALPVVHQLGIGEHVVAANGATIAEVRTGVVLEQASLPGALAVAAIERSRRAVPGVGLAVTTARGFFREPGFLRIAPLAESQGIEVADAAPAVDDLIYSVVLFADLDARDLRDALAAVAPDGVAVSPSGLAGSVELTVPGVHKGTGVASLCRRLGVDQRDVVAFGDGLNDHEMLAWAGLGVAMDNAQDETKAVADEVAPTNDDDGVAHVVERLLADGACGR
jgi:Cof subfamily protein (haloacid dehalogenase superfamily)